jgi:alkylation response protein AidB-like acyl-CoA dehydrogenase
MTNRKAAGLRRADPAGEAAMPACRRVARKRGLAPALAMLCARALPELLPCGPLGHALVPTELAVSASRVWVDGLVFARSAGSETTLARGTVVVLRHVPEPGGGQPGDGGDLWRAGLVWLRLGLSEGLLDTCVDYLGGRRCGDSTLLRQQMVMGSVADVLIEHQEAGAVLAEFEGAGLPLPEATATHLQRQLTLADRKLLRLLGASGFVAGGPGETAYLSELLAEAHARPGSADE